MKPIMRGALIVGLVFGVVVWAANSGARLRVQTPANVETFYHVSTDGSLSGLEECAGQFNSSGSGRVTIAFLACRNPKSSFRLKAGVPLEFIVRPHKDNTKKQYFLYPMTRKDDLRVFYLARPPKGARAIQTTAVKIGDSLKFKTVRPLAPGEYMFVSFAEFAGIRTIIPPATFLFGVDAP